MTREIHLQQIEHVDQHGIAQRVEHLISRLPANHDLLRAKYREMLRQVGLFDRQTFDEGARPHFPFPKRLDDRDSGGVCERLKDVGLELTEGVGHFNSNIRMFEYTTP